MTGLREQTAAAAREHINSRPYHWPPSCSCGWTNRQFGVNDTSDWQDHFADVVVEALNLTEEWAVRETYGGHRWSPQSESSAKVRAERITKRFWQEHDGVPGAAMVEPKPVLERRWVSGWSVVGETKP